MNVRFDKGSARIKLTKPERTWLTNAKETLRCFARATDSDDQREALEAAVEEIGKVLQGTSEEAAIAG